jgi:signal recognition particle GTPase
MNDEQVPSVEEIKERLKVEIPVEEEESAKADTTRDFGEELKNLGKQFADTVQSAWNSEERQRVENEIRSGVKSFVSEVDKAIHEAKESQAAAKVKEEAVEIKTKLETGDLGKKTRDGLVQGLQWLSEELGKLAEQFAPAEKSSEDVASTEESE